MTLFEGVCLQIDLTALMEGWGGSSQIGLN